MKLRPIMSKEDHRAAVAEIERLWKPEPGSEEADQLEILVTLVDAYETAHFPMNDGDPVDIIKVHMEMTGRTQRDLAGLFGSASRASEILNRKRALTLEMAHRLHTQWQIPAEALIRPYALSAA